MKRVINFIKKEKEVLGIIIGWKVIGFIIIFLGFSFLPFNEHAFRGNFIYPKDQKITIISSLKTWDAQHYLYLSEIGYKKDQSSNSFYPLYPALIRVVDIFLRNSFLSAILLSNVLSLAGLTVFYMFVKNLYDKKIALVGLSLFMSFPTAFYLNLIYTEGLFVFLSLTFFFLLYRKKYFYASIFAFLLPLARSFGIFIFIPFFIYLWQDKSKKPVKINIATFNEPIKLKFYKEYFFLLSPIAGLLADFFYMHAATGDFLVHAHSAQQFFVGQRGFDELLNPASYFSNFFSPNLALHGFNNSILDRIFFVIFLLGAILVYKKTDKPMFFYYLCLGFSPLLGSYMSFMRFLLPAFPLFIALGSFFAQQGRKILLYFILLVFYSLQMIFLIMHSLSYWVS